MKPLAILLLVIGGLCTAAGVALGLLLAPQGRALNLWLLGIFVAAGAVFDLAGVLLLHRSAGETSRRPG